jgi:uncharacterized protein YcgI (DUF1989 family)
MRARKIRQHFSSMRASNASGVISHTPSERFLPLYDGKAPQPENEVRAMSDADGLRELVVLDEIVPAGKPWGHAVRQGEILRLVDLEGQQAVDFLCFDAADPTDRYSTTNTVKVQGNSISATALYFTRIAALRCLRSSPIPAVATTRFTAAVVERTIF